MTLESKQQPAAVRLDSPPSPLSPAGRAWRATRWGNYRPLAAKLGVVALIASGSAHAQSQDEKVARSLAATCANCHGTNGQAQGAMARLAGYPADRMIAMMSEFRSGQRPATIMHQIAKGYTEPQVAAIAAFFAKQKN